MYTSEDDDCSKKSRDSSVPEFPPTGKKQRNLEKKRKKAKFPTGEGGTPGDPDDSGS